MCAHLLSRTCGPELGDKSSLWFRAASSEGAAPVWSQRLTHPPAQFEAGALPLQLTGLEITIPDDAIEIYVNNSGEVWVKQDGETDEVNVGQLELAAFVNEAGLEAMGDNLFTETAASGAPILDNPDTEGFGSILQGYLITSNVNPVTEITELVSAQRAYEMNSKIISTSDQMLTTINQLK